VDNVRTTLCCGLSTLDSSIYMDTVHIYIYIYIKLVGVFWVQYSTWSKMYISQIHYIYTVYVYIYTHTHIYTYILHMYILYV